MLFQVVMGCDSPTEAPASTSPLTSPSLTSSNLPSPTASSASLEAPKDLVPASLEAPKDLVPASLEAPKDSVPHPPTKVPSATVVGACPVHPSSDPLQALAPDTSKPAPEVSAARHVRCI